MKRFQWTLIVMLLLASCAMGFLLWQMRQRAHQRMLSGEDAAPTQAPAVAPAQEISLEVASDADGSLQTRNFSLPLPADSGSRSRAILGKLLDLYSANDATHHVPGGAASVAQVFLIPVHPAASGKGPQPATQAALPAMAPAPPTAAENSAPVDENTPQMAVVNLTSAFANGHPSGLQAETLTILSMVSTLHLNLPRITEVRFLVDGQTRPTLNGHADLSRTWLASDSGSANPAQ